MATKSVNSSLHAAKAGKNDEFYTQISDIEKELKHYKKHFKNKVVLCNCDDPRVSNFFNFFAKNFKDWGLKKLITTCYKSNSPDLFSDKKAEKAVYLEYYGEQDGNMPNLKKVGIKKLKGDGDFRSEECIELLKEADIVVTNPPFSLYREYVQQLIDHDKKFLIVGNKNAITYKEIFSLIRDNKLWSGTTPMGTDMLFDVPPDFAEELIASKKEGSAYKIIDGAVKGRAQAAWFTNLTHKKRNEELILVKKYCPKTYSKYDNFDAINVNKVAEIPVDWAGAMGVPITFLDKFNPDQFQIIGLGISTSGLEFGVRPYKKAHKEYRKNVQKRGAVDGDLYMIENGEVIVPYARVVIKYKSLEA